MRVEQQTGLLITNNVFHANELLTAPTWDDSATGNRWQNNNYSDFIAPGPYPIAGGGIFTFVDSLVRGGGRAVTVESAEDLTVEMEAIAESMSH